MANLRKSLCYKIEIPEVAALVDEKQGKIILPNVNFWIDVVGPRQTFLQLASKSWRNSKEGETLLTEIGTRLQSLRDNLRMAVSHLWAAKAPQFEKAFQSMLAETQDEAFDLLACQKIFRESPSETPLEIIGFDPKLFAAGEDGPEVQEFWQCLQCLSRTCAGACGSLKVALEKASLPAFTDSFLRQLLRAVRQIGIENTEGKFADPRRLGFPDHKAAADGLAAFHRRLADKAWPCVRSNMLPLIPFVTGVLGHTEQSVELYLTKTFLPDVPAIEFEQLRLAYFADNSVVLPEQEGKVSAADVCTLLHFAGSLSSCLALRHV